MRRLDELLHHHSRHGDVGGQVAEPSNRGWAGDLELVDSDNPYSKNRFFAREIEVSAAEFEECRKLYETSVQQGGGVKRKGSSSRFGGGRDGLDMTREDSLQPASPGGMCSPDSPTARRLSRSQSMLLQMPARTKRVRHRSCLSLPIVSPFARWYRAWRWIILALDATYAAFLVPIHAAMQFEARSQTLFTGMDTVELVATALYSIDIVVQFNVAWIAVSEDLKQILVLDGKKIAKFYVRKGFFIDFVTTIPMIIELLTDLIAESIDELPAWVTAMSPWIRALRLLRFVRVFRICRLDFLTRITGRMDVISPSVSSLVMLIYFISFGVNLLGCMWYMIAWFGGVDDSWLSTKSILVQVGVLPDGEPELEETPLTEADFYSQLVASLYWATTTVTTVGYGDITPANTFEMGVAIVVEFLGVLVFGLLIGILSSVFLNNSRQARSAQALQDRIQEANEWMVARHLPKDLRKTVRTFYTDVWQRQVMTHHDAKMLEDLPFALRSKVVMSIVKQSMEKSPQNLLRIMPPSVQELLAASMVPVTVCSGQDLIKEGRPTEHFWLLHSGEMAELHKLRVAALQIAPSFLGMLNLVQLILDGEEAVGKPSICGFRSIGMSNTWQIELLDFAHVLDAFPRVRVPLIRSNINYLESCIMNPSPVEQWDKVAAELLERLQSASPQRTDSGSGCSGSSARLGDDPDMLGMDLPNHIEMLRKRELQIKVTNKFRSLVRQQHRKQEKRAAFRLDLAQSHWQLLSMYVQSGEYRKYFVLHRRRTSLELVSNVGSRLSATSSLRIELPQENATEAVDVDATDASTTTMTTTVGRLDSDSKKGLTAHKVHFSEDT